MSRERIDALERYLRGLAPRFFAERLVGASESSIGRLETAARTSLSDAHRAFLRSMGATPATVLNPFLSNCDFCVQTLLTDYDLIYRGDESCPPRVVLFSSSDILGERIFLQNGLLASDEPAVGDVSELSPSGSFFPKANAAFGSYLESSAFWFRLSQGAHQLRFAPPYDAAANTFTGEPDKLESLLIARGFQMIFRCVDGERCLDRGDVAASFQADGSGVLAGDASEELDRVAEALGRETWLRFEPVGAGWRSRAPSI